jgi:ABC-type sugar transport system permease subunit
MSRTILNASPRARTTILLSPVLLFVMPAVILLLVFSVAPILMTFVFAWTDQRLIPAPQLPTEFVGLRNFTRLLEDDHFLTAFPNTLLFTLIVGPIQMLLGLTLALLVNQRLPGMNAFRAIYFLPSTTSFLVVALAWSGLGKLGWPLEPLLKLIGYDQNNFAQAMLWTVWQGAGLEMLIYLAALQTIPKELHEAAALDGANAWQHFRFVTLRFLRNASVFVLVTTVIKCVQVYDPLLFVSSNPNQTARSLVIMLSEEGFSSLKVGYASAIGLIIFVLILFVFALQRLVLRERPSCIANPQETALGRFWNAIIAPLNAVQSRGLDWFWLRFRVVFLYLIACVLALFFLVPWMYLFSSALKTDPAQLERDFNSWRSLLPIGKLGLENIWQNLNIPEIRQGLVNSLLVVAFLLPLNLLVNGTFAYALARFRFRAREALFFVVVALNFVPFTAQAVPLLLIVNSFGWTSTLHVLVIPFVASALSTFLFYQFFLNFPKELEDAANVDGANWWQVFWFIVLPLSAPVFSTVALLTFLANWGNFFWPTMTIYEPEVMPIALSIGYTGPNPALGVILALPALTLFLVSQRWFIRSITSGAINE